MKVIWLKKIPDGPAVGQVTNVADAYARNFLLPQNIARLATPALLAAADRQKTMAQQLTSARQQSQLSAQQQLADVVVKVIAPSNAQGTLFAAVKQEVVLRQLQKISGVDMAGVELEPPSFKVAGIHQAILRWPGGAQTKIQVAIN